MPELKIHTVKAEEQEDEEITAKNKSIIKHGAVPNQNIQAINVSNLLANEDNDEDFVEERDDKVEIDPGMEAFEDRPGLKIK
jgi:cobyric acid synthase